MSLFNDTEDYYQDFNNDTLDEEESKDDEIFVMTMAIWFSFIFLCFCCADIYRDTCNENRKWYKFFSCSCKFFKKKKNLIVETKIKEIECRYTIQNHYFTSCTCPICFENKKKIVVLECKHSFCKDCIDTWLEKNKTCPLCRLEIL